MKQKFTLILTTCLLGFAPLVHADNDASFLNMLAQMSPAEKAAFAKMVIARSDANLQAKLAQGQHHNIEKGNILYESNNTLVYRLTMRHNAQIAQMLANENQKALLDELMGNAMKHQLCHEKNENIRSIALLGIENMRIQMRTDNHTVMDKSFPIQECLNSAK